MNVAAAAVASATALSTVVSPVIPAPVQDAAAAPSQTMSTTQSRSAADDHLALASNDAVTTTWMPAH
ncbi:hypothetical protein [Actinophytocola sp.]|uniref:hypothetical protein n=1 Tax=Actinophytocola sp. TaxID=1872138 RepID=UPI003D6AFB23